jgi:predicted O-methyltransferase YrrM
LKVFGHWKDREVRMLEIGSHEGRSAIWWCQNLLLHPQSRLTCVDPWTKTEERHQRFLNNISKAGVLNKITVLRMHSESFYVAPEIYDFVYLDGDHRASAVFHDLSICWRLLKKGGLLLLDDYTWTQPNMIGPKVAIDGFLASFQCQYKLLHKGYQIILKKL